MHMSLERIAAVCLCSTGGWKYPTGTAMSENVNLTRQAGSSMESKRVPGQLLEPKSSTIYKISDPLLKFAPLQRNECSLIFMERQRILTTNPENVT